MSDTLSSFASRLTAVERRVRWPGATQITLPPDGVLLPSIAGTFQPVGSLTLDPGGWLVMAGGAAWRSFKSGGYSVGIRVVGITPGQSINEGLQDVGSVTTTSVNVQGIVTLAEQTTLVMEMSYFATIGSYDAVAIDAYMIAYPT